MGEKTDEIRHRIEQARNRLGQDLNQLEYQVRRKTDWRVQFSLHPWAFLVAVFGGALALGWVVGHPRPAFELKPVAAGPSPRRYRWALPAGRD